jgi:hypothetical protein
LAEEIRLDVVSRGHNRGLDETSRALREVKSESDKVGRSFKETADATFDMDKAVAEARVEIERLNAEFKKTGDRALLKEIRSQQRDLDSALKVIRGATRPGIDFGGAGIRPRNALIGIAAASVAALSPMIGAAIAGAVTGAVGLGGIVGGIAAASKDPRVRAAAKSFGEDISTQFFSSGDAFVQPVIDSLGILRREFRALDLESLFGPAAPFVTDLAEGVGGFLRELSQGFNTVLARSGEVIPVVADGLVRLGDGLGSMITEMASSKGTIEGIRFLFEAVAETAHVVGVSVKFLADRFHELGNFSGNLSGALEDIAAAMPFIGDDNMFSRINDHIESVTGSGGNLVRTLTKVDGGVAIAKGQVANSLKTWEDYKKVIDDANTALERSINLALQQDNANHGLQSAMLDLRESIKENGKDWRTNTEAGLENRRALLDAVAAAERKREADIASGVEADKANAAYQRTINKLKGIATDAGISATALDDLVGDYDINIHINTRGRVPRVRFTNLPEGEIFPSNRRRAAGGPVGPGAWLVGERGPEVLQLGSSASGHMYPTLGSYRSRFAGGGSARPVHITVNGTHEDAELIARISREVQRQGGTLAVIGIRG